MRVSRSLISKSKLSRGQRRSCRFASGGTRLAAAVITLIVIFILGLLPIFISFIVVLVIIAVVATVAAKAEKSALVGSCRKDLSRTSMSTVQQRNLGSRQAQTRRNNASDHRTFRRLISTRQSKLNPINHSLETTGAWFTKVSNEVIGGRTKTNRMGEMTSTLARTLSITHFSQNGTHYRYN